MSGSSRSRSFETKWWNPAALRLDIMNGWTWLCDAPAIPPRTLPGDSRRNSSTVVRSTDFLEKGVKIRLSFLLTFKVDIYLLKKGRMPNCCVRSTWFGAKRLSSCVQETNSWRAHACGGWADRTQNKTSLDWGKPSVLTAVSATARSAISATFRLEIIKKNVSWLSPPFNLLCVERK